MYIQTYKLPKHPLAMEIYAAMLGYITGKPLEEYIQLRIGSLVKGMHWEYVVLDPGYFAITVQDYLPKDGEEIEPKELLDRVHARSINL